MEPVSVQFDGFNSPGSDSAQFYHVRHDGKVILACEVLPHGAFRVALRTNDAWGSGPELAWCEGVAATSEEAYRDACDALRIACRKAIHERLAHIQKCQREIEDAQRAVDRLKRI